jgi:hypothetical protein
MANGSEMMRIRIPADLKAWLRAKSLENHRSMNSEIIHRLSIGLPEDKPNNDRKPENNQ